MAGEEVVEVRGREAESVGAENRWERSYTENRIGDREGMDSGSPVVDGFSDGLVWIELTDGELGTEGPRVGPSDALE